RELAHHDVGPVSAQRLRLPDAIHAHYEPVAGGAQRRDAGERVLHAEGVRRRDPQPLEGVEEGVRSWLPREPESRRLHAPDALVEQLSQPRRLEDGVGVPTGRHQGGLHPELAHPTDEGDRAIEHLDAISTKPSLEDLVLTLAESPDALSFGRIVRIPLGQLDPASREEGAQPILTRLAVDVAEVVLLAELLERTGSARRALPQQPVEELLPGGEVQPRAVRDDPIEVEHPRAVRRLRPFAGHRHPAPPTARNFSAAQHLPATQRTSAASRPSTPQFLRAARCLRAAQCFSAPQRFSAASRPSTPPCPPITQRTPTTVRAHPDRQT